MIKVGFWYDRPQEYTGGLNYIRNLLFALGRLEKKKIAPYIFFGKKVDASVVKSFEGLATVVQTSLLDRKSPFWFLHKILFRFFGSLLMVELVLKGHGVSILSHAEHVYGKYRSFKIVSWIPDFQYLHLPEMFPGMDTGAETERVRRIASQSDALILSSHAAFEDYCRIAGDIQINKIKVLQFVSQPKVCGQSTGEWTLAVADIEKKYGFKGGYFFLPNQFWKHKNHTVVFEAIRILKEQGIDVLLLCSGNLHDYRIKDGAYVKGLLQYIEEKQLAENIKILGVIDYADVLFLMRNCIAVVNPSRFEGWSSTVEEAKSMGKRVVLSNIAVHHEQVSSGGFFFNVDDSKSLARGLADHWINSSPLINEAEASYASENLQLRTRKYAEEYTDIIQSI